MLVKGAQLFNTRADKIDDKSFTHLGLNKIHTILQMTFSNERFWKKVYISMQISLKFVLMGLFVNKPSLVQVMA